MELTSPFRDDIPAIVEQEERTLRCLGYDLFSALMSPWRPARFLRILTNCQYTDILFLMSDPLPFFATYFVDIPMQLWLFWRTGKTWDCIDYFNNRIVSNRKDTLKTFYK